jgi:hypothetical protein
VTLERGFRRILIVVSAALLGLGSICLLLLAAAWGWSSHLDRAMAARVADEGCPPQVAMCGGHAYDGGVKGSPVVTRLSQSRWRVAVPKQGSTSFYVVNTRRDLTDSQMVTIADNRPASVDFMASRWQALPEVEVVDCLWATHEIGEQNRAAVSSRFVTWWMDRPFVWVVLWPVAMWMPLDATLALATITSPLILASAATALLWAMFYVLRWIARGFTGG